MAKEKNDSVVNTAGQRELCFIMFRYDVFLKKRVAEALDELEHLDGIRLLHFKTVVPTVALMEKLYPKKREWLMRMGEKTIGLLKANNKTVKLDAFNYGAKIYDDLIKTNSEGMVLAIIVSGVDACSRVAEHIGDPCLSNAKNGTMRVRYTTDQSYKAFLEIRSIRNWFHYSSDPYEGLRETNLFFPEFSLPDLIKQT